MMTQAFYTGISGIRSNQYAIDVTSDNLANISTTGFRGSEYEFASLFEDAIHTSHSLNSSSIGIGSRIQATALKQGQGVLEKTDRSTDLAILGDGWFGIQGEGNPIYTRDGAFTFDSNDDLVSLDGFHVLGTMGGNIDGTKLTADLEEVILGDVGAQVALRFPESLTYPAKPSSIANFQGNIGTIGEVQTMGATVIDSFNNKNHLKLSFSASTPQVVPGSQWDVVATTGTLDGTTIYDTQTATLGFDAEGGLISNTLTSINNNGATVDINIGSAFTGVVSIAGAITSSTSADGTAGGDLEGYTVNRNGEVLATFTNGEQSSVGKVAIYHFQNDQGLTRINGSKFEESSNSGRPVFYKNEAGENVIGTTLTNYSLEGSNIDMTYGITELIILQRSFDANSKSITTADQMMQKALNMDA